VYWLVIVINEIVLLIDEGRAYNARARAVAKRGKDGGEKGGSLSPKAGGGAVLAGAPQAAVMGPTDTTTNPMFLSSASEGSGSLFSSDLDVQSIAEMKSVPDPAVWVAVRNQFVSALQRNEALTAELAALKRAAASASASAGDDDDGDGAAGLFSGPSASSPLAGNTLAATRKSTSSQRTKRIYSPMEAGGARPTPPPLGRSLVSEKQKLASRGSLKSLK
jgi:hypothetical protein